MTSSRSSDGSPTMADPHELTRPPSPGARVATRAARMATLVLLAWAFTGVFAAIAVAAPPLESCQPGQNVSEGGVRVCTSVGVGGGGISIGALLPKIGRAHV